MKFLQNGNDVSSWGSSAAVCVWYSNPYLLLVAGMSIFFVGVSLFYVPIKVYKDEILSREQKWHAVFFLIISWICIGLIPFVPFLSSNSYVIDVLNFFLPPALLLLPHFFYVAKYGGMAFSLILHVSLITSVMLFLVLGAATSSIC